MSRSEADPVRTLLARLEGVKRGPAGWEARCPSHEDARPSLSVARGEDGRALVCCHANQGCTPESIAHAVGLSLRDLFAVSAPPGQSRLETRVVCTYPYEDETGRLLFEVVRLANPKDFRQRRPDGRGGWIWSVRGVRRMPYRLPGLVEAARSGRTLFVVEGEKDADRLRSLGLVATCNPGGAGKWGSDLCEPFRGARVVVICDNDDAGRRHARDVAAKLSGVSREVRILELPDLPPHGDVSDWLDAGYTPEHLLSLAEAAPLQPLPADGSRSAEPIVPMAARTLPPPMSVGDMLALAEPEETWIAEGLIPGGSNVLLAAYPKSYKTFVCLELAVAACTGAAFLGRFRVPGPRRVAMALMEGSAWRTRRRMERLCEGKGGSLHDLEGSFFFWFRPPLRLSSPAVMRELASYVVDYRLDLLLLDNWSYLATGNSNDSDEVTPQLDALSRLRERRPGLTVVLVHHARKAPQDGGGDRLTDVIRNSSAFGAWYDVGVVLARRGESGPVAVRVELRDHPSAEPFAFTVDDEFPAGPEQGLTPGGWLRLQVSDLSPERAQSDAAAERLRPAVLDFLRSHPGCSKNQLEAGIGGDRGVARAALEALCREGIARCDPPERRGQSSRCWLLGPTSLDLAATSLAASPGDLAGFAASPRRGVRTANPGERPPADDGRNGGLDRAAGWEEIG